MVALRAIATCDFPGWVWAPYPLLPPGATVHIMMTELTPMCIYNLQLIVNRYIEVDIGSIKTRHLA